MELITTHIGADFDALASVVAARKLYPQAKAMLPGSPEKAVRDFLSLWQDELNLDHEKDIDYNQVKKLIIVETRIASRIGKAEKIAGKRGVRIEVYDHHPRTSHDIKADKDILKATGATVTILLDMLKKRKIAISPLEATVMALGIYEDTGSLTFQTTTRGDIDMVGYLFSQGASLNTVSSYLKRELTHSQLASLSTLINKTHDYIINGVHVGVVALEAEGYVEDFALLVHKLIDIENFNVLFAFVKVGSKIQMVARSNIPYVKVNKIAEAFGGGGHPYAASAKIRGMELEETLSKLMSLLKKVIKPRVFAEDIMSPVSKTISGSAKVAEARSLIRTLKSDALVVCDDKKITGIIARSDIERAAKKGYGHSRVKGYMKTRFARITPKTPLYKIEQIVSKEKAGSVPVFKNRKVAGMVSRSDIAKAIHKDLVNRKSIVKRSRGLEKPAKNLLAKMKKSLPLRIYKILRLLGDRADKKGYQVFAVGGFVRDVLLGVKNFDVDIVLEGDGLKFAKELSDTLNASLVVHKRFGTAAVVTNLDVEEKRGAKSRPEKFKIDIATARQEYYEYPAALPKVRFSSIKQDLYRRDFTINAMAVSLNRKNFGSLIDFFHGQRDLRSKKIRVLHDMSFVEDPTRIFRAVRFEQRYNFSIDPHTEELIRTAVGLDMFGKTQKQRLRDEIILILSEEEPPKALIRMHQLHELRFIEPGLKLTKRVLKLFDSIDEAQRSYRACARTRRLLDTWIIYFMALVDTLTLRQVKRICEKFVFCRGDEKRIISCKKVANKIIKILETTRHLAPSQIYRHLEPLPYEVIVYIMAKSNQRAKERISLFLKRHNGARLSIGGRDLKSFGLLPGPRYKRILNKILYDKLDGKVSSRDGELRLAERLSRRR